MNLIDCSEPTQPQGQRRLRGVREPADLAAELAESILFEGRQVRGRFVPASRSVMEPDGPSPSETKEQFA